MSLARFIALWTHPNYGADSVSEEDLDGAERRLETRLPADYRSAVLEHGLPRPTIELLDATVDRELDVPAVSDFLNPEEMVFVTEDWRDLGLPEELVAFATDSMGNLFCFPIDAGASAELPVFFFDHDKEAVDSVASSFTQWIDQFCAIAPLRMSATGGKRTFCG